MNKENKLGMGLGALLSTTNNNSESSNGIQKINISQIIPNPSQPRKNFKDEDLKELSSSIKNQGLIQPIIVKPIKDNQFQIIAGERRWRASQIAKLHEVPVIIRSFNDETALGVAMIENLQRSDLNLVEEAQGYRALMNNFEYTQEKLSLHLGKSRSHIANVLRILSLPKYVRRHITSGDISFGHARTLVTLPEDKANQIADEIIDKDLSVRQTEKMVSSLKKADKTSTRSGFIDNSYDDRDPNIENLERDLTRSTLICI